MRSFLRFTPTLLGITVIALAATPAALALRFTDDDFDMPVGQLGVPYSKQFHGGAGCGPALPYQFRILSGNLPPGITFDSSGLVSGTPTRVGSWSFWVELSDQDPPTAAWCVPKKSQREFTITVAPSSLTAEVARPFTESLPGTGWSLAQGSALPTGLAFDPTSGVISGQPADAGSSQVQLVQVNALGWKNNVAIKLTVAPPLSLTTGALRNGKVGRAYVVRLTTQGGAAPYSWKVVHGVLPAGFHLGARTGVVAGTARRPGTAHLTIQVTDRFRAVATRSLVLKILR
jgi:putative Ig domain-containing protein